MPYCLASGAKGMVLNGMTFTVKGMCRHGALVHRRKTPDAALRKARELANNGCYDLHIVTPEGRDYHSSEFGDLPRSRVAKQTARPQPRQPGGKSR